MPQLLINLHTSRIIHIYTHICFRPLVTFSTHTMPIHVYHRIVLGLWPFFPTYTVPYIEFLETPGLPIPSSHLYKYPATHLPTGLPRLFSSTTLRHSTFTHIFNLHSNPYPHMSSIIIHSSFSLRFDSPVFSHHQHLHVHVDSQTFPFNVLTHMCTPLLSIPAIGLFITLVPSLYHLPIPSDA